MSTGMGENENGLRKIMDFTRLSSIVILLLHFYYYCYGAFSIWGWVSPISDKILTRISHTGLFHTIYYSKLLALTLLLISLIGVKGKKEEKISSRSVLLYLVIGILLYFFSSILLKTTAG